jgi:hypothetical protein
MKDGKSLFMLLAVNFIVIGIFFYVMYFYPFLEHRMVLNYSALVFLVVLDVFYFLGKFFSVLDHGGRKVRLQRTDRKGIREMQIRARENLDKIEKEREKKKAEEIAKERERFQKMQEKEKEKHERKARSLRHEDNEKNTKPSRSVLPQVVSSKPTPLRPRPVPSKVIQNDIHDNVLNINVDQNESKRLIIVGSKTGKKVHKPDCIIAMRIPKEKRVIFHDKLSSVRAGYSACSVCLPFQK